MDREAYWIWLSKTKCFNLNQKQNYVNQKVDLPQLYNEFRSNHEESILTYAKVILNKNREYGIKMITPDSEYYNSYMPFVLYYKGKPSFEKATSVIGTRKCTAHGYYYTKDIVKRLVNDNIVINSGLAYGIDSIAHQAALENSGITQAFLAHGLDQCYPRSHYNLLSKIIDMGCAFSEYEVGVSSHKFRFLERNRLMAYMSDEIVVIEASTSSGAFYTGNMGLSLGKKISTVEGPSDSIKCSGNLQLLKLGAFKVETEPLAWNNASDQLKTYLRAAPRSTDDLLKQSGFSLSELEEWLIETECSRWITLKPDGKWHYNGW